MPNYFKFGDTELNHLKSVDKTLGEVIDKNGHINRVVDDDIFSAIMHKIIGQQISRAALTTVWKRLTDKYGEITPKLITSISKDELQSIGITFKKAGYMIDVAHDVVDGHLNLEGLYALNDEQVIDVLVRIPGIGKWTAEMILLFCMQRPNIISYGDIAIKRGLMKIYGYDKITPEIFEKHRKIYSPFCSVASLYIWQTAVPE